MVDINWTSLHTYHLSGSHLVHSGQFFFQGRREMLSKGSPVLLTDFILETVQDL